MKEEEFQDLLSGNRSKMEQQIERLEDEKKLTEIIHSYRVKGRRSYEIARAVISYVKGE
jgi:hypothetical protein